MRNYEALFIIRPDLGDEEQKQLYQKIQDNIKKHSGQTQDAEEWGKKRLSFKIGKHREGIYYLLRFSIDPGQVKPLNRDFKLNESFIRTAVTERRQIKTKLTEKKNG